MIRSISDLDISGKRVLVRVDFNVPLDDQQHITDDTRIREALPTIRYIIEHGASAILMSHMGRPKGRVNAKYSLIPVAQHLAQLLARPVQFVADCRGDIAHSAAAAAKPGDVLLLENLRFYAEEEQNSEEMSKDLASLGDMYCNDAFGTAHRAHASTEGVARFFEGRRAAGFLIAKELQYLGSALRDPKRPFVAILGGSKVSDKIQVIANLLTIADKIVIGGGMANTFFKAQGHDVGDSLCELDAVQTAKDLLASASDKIVLPVDAVIADAFDAAANTQVVAVDAVPAGWRILDIGPASVQKFDALIESASTIVWNGPMGVFEMPAFNKGTFAIAQSMANATAKGAISIVGGGDSAAAITQSGLQDKVSHVSTGGGASLEFLEGKKLPGIEILNENVV